jgi:hypothetical protein
MSNDDSRFSPKIPNQYCVWQIQNESELTTKRKLAGTIETTSLETLKRAEPLGNCRVPGIVIDSREEQTENSFDWANVNAESLSNEIDETERQEEKQCKPKS